MASVGCCVRLRFPRVSMSSSCSAEVGYGGDAQEGGCGLPERGFSPQQEEPLFRTSQPLAPPTPPRSRASPNCPVREPRGLSCHLSPTPHLVEGKSLHHHALVGVLTDGKGPLGLQEVVDLLIVHLRRKEARERPEGQGRGRTQDTMPGVALCRAVVNGKRAGQAGLIPTRSLSELHRQPSGLSVGPHLTTSYCLVSPLSLPTPHL